MLQAVAVPGEGVRLREVPVPSPGPGEVLVRTSLVGICGSDTHALAGQHPFLTAPYIPGHEATGEVIAVGDGVRGLPEGQRVLLKPNVSCGTCVDCRAGRSNACQSLSWIGCDPTMTLAGAMAEYFTAPAANLYPIPDGMDEPTAALIEPLSTPVHAARLAGDLSGCRVAVVGAGTIGTLSIVAALHAGADAVVATDLEQSKLDRALRIGARAGVLASSDDLIPDVLAALDGEADVVFDCVANERSIDAAVHMLRRAGTLLLVGVPPTPAQVPLPLVQDWELRLQGCAAYTHIDIVAALDLALSGLLPTDALTSSTYPLEQVTEAFQAAAADTSGKVLLTVH